MNRSQRLDHQKFKELAALAQRATLSNSERLDLELHLRVCSSCRQAQEEYVAIGTEGMDFLVAALYGHSDHASTWDDRPARAKLLTRVREAEQVFSPAKGEVFQMPGVPLPRGVLSPWVGGAAAVCVLIAVAIGAYNLSARRDVAKHRTTISFAPDTQALALDKQRSDDLMASEKAQLDRLQVQASKSRFEVARLKDALRAAETRSAALATASQERDQEIRQVRAERDKLAAQLQETEQSYRLQQAELATLRAEHDRALVHTASLQSKIDELTQTSRDQARRIDDEEQYLASDRDIRELMGARKLYIADVFDVDSGSRTRKPFGRVFYTQNKSLIFYAFDLDRQPGVKNASAFQVWGQRDAETGEKNPAMNLGILYMDSESNRRWVLRLDDPKQLAEIDAVFVTVEPHGGSQKPTGKPFLYALLRKEANHP
jgi:hypothetical protein